MFFNKLFRREQEPGKAAAETAEHIAPPDYFTPERMQNIGQSLGKLRTVEIQNIQRVD